MLVAVGQGDDFAVHRDRYVSCNIALLREELGCPTRLRRSRSRCCGRMISSTLKSLRSTFASMRPTRRVLLWLLMIPRNQRCSSWGSRRRRSSKRPSSIRRHRARRPPGRTLRRHRRTSPLHRTPTPSTARRHRRIRALCSSGSAANRGWCSRCRRTHGSPTRSAGCSTGRRSSLLSRRSRMYRMARRRTRACRSGSRRPPRRRCSCPSACTCPPHTTPYGNTTRISSITPDALSSGTPGSRLATRTARLSN